MDASNAPLFSLNVSQFEQLLKPMVEKAVNEAFISAQLGPQIEPQDEIFIDEVALITHRSKSTVYRLTCTREIPFKKRGRQLVFSRKDITAWLEDRTVNIPQLSDEVADHLQKTAQKRV